MSNIVTKRPSRGDIVLKEIASKAVSYITLDSFVLADVDTTKYEIIGVVYYRKGKDVGVVYKTNASKKWSERYYHKITGYTLDGTARTGVISIRESSSASANTDYTVSYNATTKEGLCEQLNAFFQANNTFKTQDWYAEIVDGEVNVHYAYTFYQQASYNTGKSGFAFTANLLPDYPALANMRRKHGGNGGEGAVSNMTRALTYFRSDLTSTTYNPSSDVTDIKRTYPVCLPAYLGTSANQSDHCALLRATYGEGEDGWKKFMESCLPVYPTDWGNMGMNNGKARTALLASKKYSSTIKTNEYLCPASAYAYNLETTTIEKGEFWLPTTREIAMILDGVQYSTTNDRNADVLNKALNKIGGSAISNGANWWSCLRFGASGAWCSNGYVGFFGGYYMDYACNVVPVSLYTIA